MNYALDALWWKLRQQNVRDLASVLTAPPLWNSACELPVSILLGDTGFRYLLALDEQPESLLNYLKPLYPYQYRLGIYAEHLLAFWFSHSPHWSLLAHNCVVMHNNQTAGALDFIAQTKNVTHSETYHVEMACKYYFSTQQPATEASFLGFNQNDTLLKKVNKLTSQIALPIPENLSLSEKNVIRATLIRGNAFSLSESLAQASMLNPYAWAGKVRTHDDLCENGQDERFFLIKPLFRLSPVRQTQENCLTVHELKQLTAPAIIARVEVRYDGFWHEAERFVLL